MSLSENSRYWVERMRAEVAAIPMGFWWVIDAKKLAEVEFAYGLLDEAKATLRSCLDRFDLLKPVWTSHMYHVAQQCARLDQNQWLEAEVRRGLEWLSDTEYVSNLGKWVGETVHALAVQTGQADVAAELVSDEWPGRTANQLIDACGIAGWTKNVAELQRLLPLARAAVEAAGPNPDGRTGNVGYVLTQACIASGWLAALPELCEEFACPGDEAVIALWSAPDRSAYARVRDHWVSNHIERYRAAPDEARSCSSQVRYAAETIRCLGDADGYRRAAEQFREATAASMPARPWERCGVNCDLAVLFANAGEDRISAAYFDAAKRMFQGKDAGVKTARGNRSIMASILSAAYCDLGETDPALEFAHKCRHAGDREGCLLRALILGGPVAEAEAGLVQARQDASGRAGTIGSVLLSKFQIGLRFVLCRTVDA